MHNSREKTGREAGRAQGHSVGGLCLRTAQSNTLQCLAYSSPRNLRDILDSPCAAAGLGAVCGLGHCRGGTRTPCLDGE